MELFDRDADLEALDAALVRAAGGSGGTVLVTGPAGIGKTSLLRAFVSGIGCDVRVLRGACEDLSVAEPLGPLQDLLHGVDPRLAERLAEGVALFGTFAEVLDLCAAHPGGTVVVVEDLHWADDATVDFVRFAARRIAERPVLLLVSSRAEESGHRQVLRRAFGDLPSEMLERLALGPLSEAAVERLCRGKALNPARIHAASGGNAFYVSELLRDTGTGLPRSIRDAVLARVDRLSPDARAVLEVVSIVPRRAELDDVAALAGQDTETDLAIERCLDAGLLRVDGDALAFQHEIARAAVESSLSDFRKRALHRRMFKRLSEIGEANLSRLLHHAQGAGDRTAVAELAPRAAAAAQALGARREATAYYVQAVEAAGDACEADLLEATAAACVSGAHALAAGFQERALAMIKADGDPSRYGDGLRKLSRYRWMRSDLAGAFEAIEEAIEVLSSHHGPELAQAYSSLSQLLMTGFRTDEVEDPALRAIGLAKEFDRPDIISHALNNLGMSKTSTDPETGRAMLKESIDIGLTLDDPDHAARAMGNWMHFEYHRCEFRKALRRAEIAAEYTREQELDSYYHYALGMIARANLDLGEWDGVRETAMRGFDPDDRVPENYHFNAAIALFAHQVRTGAPPDTDVEAYLALFDTDTAEAQRIGPYAEVLAERAWLMDEDRAPVVRRLHCLLARTSDPSKIGGVAIWLKRFGEDLPEADMTFFPAPYRLELEGDVAGAARAWADLEAPFNQALTLAFGTPADQARAAEIFQRLGASPAIERMARIAGTRAPPRRGRPPAVGPYGLTERQLDVLRLLDEGLTNGQIGETLFISPKTVDHHVSAILARLEASSRGEAAAKARRENLI